MTSDRGHFYPVGRNARVAICALLSVCCSSVTRRPTPATQRTGRWERRPFEGTAPAVHSRTEAPRALDTDWPQILALYGLLELLAPGPMVALNRVVAVAMVHGPQAALEQLRSVAEDPAVAWHHRVDAVRAHLPARARERRRGPLLLPTSCPTHAEPA